MTTQKSTLRGTERLKIASAKRFFEGLKQDGINVYFEKQLKDNDIVSMIKKVMV